MAVNATIANRITDLIGSEYSTIPSNSYKDLINAAFNEIADSIKPELLLKYSRTPINVTSASGVSIEDKKILKVIRVDANSNGVDKECQFLEQTDYSIASDANSMYKATSYSPVYTLYSINEASTVLIHPDCNSSGQVGRIWLFHYALADSDLNGINTDTLNRDRAFVGDVDNYMNVEARNEFIEQQDNEYIQSEEVVEEETTTETETDEKKEITFIKI